MNDSVVEFRESDKVLCYNQLFSGAVNVDRLQVRGRSPVGKALRCQTLILERCFIFCLIVAESI
jgi:hypothetical protein